MDQKQTEQFLIRLGGAMTGGLEDAGLEAYYKNQVVGRPFPYIEFSPQFPVGDDLLVGGLAIPPWVIGYLLEEDAKKRGDTKQQKMGEDLKIFGEGDACYAFPMVVRRFLVRVFGLSMVEPSGVAAARPPTSGGSPPPTPQATVLRL